MRRTYLTFALLGCLLTPLALAETTPIPAARLFIPIAGVAMQTTVPTFTVIAGQPVTLEWDHPWDSRAAGVDLLFQAWTDTSISKNYATSELTVTPAVAPATGFVYQAAHAGFARGTHAFKLRARNSDGGFTDSLPISIIATSAIPPAPGTPRVIIKTVAGGVQIEVESGLALALAAK